MAAERRAQHAPLLEGQVIANFGRYWLAELPDSTILECVARGRRHDVACGDRVRLTRLDGERAVIEDIAPRATLLYRSDVQRQKLICANATQVAIVVAAVPGFNPDLVNRCLFAAEYAGMSAVIVLNKSDLPQTADAYASLQHYEALGYRLVTLCARRDLQPLRPYLEGRASVLVGQSGMGKSTIINQLAPDAAARVAEISRVRNAGRHTTTYARLYRLGTNTSVIDSPGIQVFGLHHLDCDAAAHALPEFREWLGHCRFRDCRHLGEPGCAIDHAYQARKITAGRLESYRRLAHDSIARRTFQPRRPGGSGSGFKR